mmetsp:Transcript_78602/g.230638  ORF Transcript_78602/g.230638 Transcript_78602/m.230638 type:complete len:253 (+) Transcript_78602:1029-1787(+)
MRKRFFSSSSVNVSMSCVGSLKCSSSSSSEETSSYEAAIRRSSSSFRRWKRLLRACRSLSRCIASSSSSFRLALPRFLDLASAASALSSAALRSSCSSSSAVLFKIGANSWAIHLSRRWAFLASLSSRCCSFHSDGVSLIKNCLYRAHSSRTSLNLPISLCTPSILLLMCLIFCSLSCFRLAYASAAWLAFVALASLSCKKSSNFFLSWSSICCDFANASSFIFAFSSSLTISAFFTSQAMCAKKTSRFFCT